MPYRIWLQLIHTKFAILSTFGIPIAGFGAFLSFIEYLDLTNKPFWALIAAIFISLFSYLGVRKGQEAKIKITEIESEVKNKDISKSADNDKSGLLLQIFQKAIDESEKARIHFSDSSAEQRNHFGRELVEFRNHYELKMQEIRDEKHDKLDSIASEMTRLKLFYTMVSTKVKENDCMTIKEFDFINNQIESTRKE